jgi:hypothetical protein
LPAERAKPLGEASSAREAAGVRAAVAVACWWPTRPPPSLSKEALALRAVVAALASVRGRGRQALTAQAASESAETSR